jgi:hypothetical protein
MARPRTAPIGIAGLREGRCIVAAVSESRCSPVSLAMSLRRLLAPSPDIGYDGVQIQLVQPLVPFGSVITASLVKQLKEPDHSDQPQFATQRFQAGAFELFLG